MPHTLRHILAKDKAALESALALDSGSARIEVQMLLQRVLSVSRAYLLAHPGQVLDDVRVESYRALLQRRLDGEPLAYILGEREFFGLMFRVTPDVLIPRPETELLVELALGRIPSPSATLLPLPQAGEGQGRGSAFRVLDLGTGSGAIALSIAHARPSAQVLACDASAAALEVARENARRLLVQSESVHTSTAPARSTPVGTPPLCGDPSAGLVRTDISIANVRLLCSDWFSELAGGRFDLIVSNPPYIAADNPHLQRGDVRFEPSSALASGDDGLHDIRRIISQARTYLDRDGWLLLEHGYDQAARVRELLQQNGFSEIFSACDLAGIERVSGGRA